MWKLLASVLCLAAVGGPVTVALAATDIGSLDRPTSVSDRDRDALTLERERLAARADAGERAAAAERRRERRARQSNDVGVPAALEGIAACESGGDPHAVGGGGAYRGKYQF